MNHLSDAGKKVAAVLAGERGGCILLGDCLERLREIPDGSVQCCVTSPPYWGLRSYGVPPTVWPPEHGEACEGHVWGDAMPRPGTESRNGEGGGSCFEGREDKAAINAAMTRAPRKRSPSDIKDPNSKQATSRASAWDSDASGGQYCQRCGAWLGCYGLEPTPELYVWHTVLIFREVRRVLREDGTLWLNLGDSYMSSGGATRHYGYADAKYPNGRNVTYYEPQSNPHPDIKPKDLVGVPWRVAFALQADGWWLRQDIIWAKPNPMPESVTDRCTKAHEYIFLMSKSGSPTLWRHKQKGIAYTQPEPDYVWKNRKTGELTSEEPPNWRTEKYDPDDDDYEWDDDDGDGDGGRGLHRLWSRINLWAGCDYYYDHEAVKEPSRYPEDDRKARSGAEDKRNGSGDSGLSRVRPGSETYPTRNKRSVWTVATQPYRGAHYAVFPPKLITPCILAGCPAGGVVLDPFIGSGTTGMVCVQHGRRYLGIELKPDHVEQAYGRISGAQPPLFTLQSAKGVV
jgi:DNA modification methylase